MAQMSFLKDELEQNGIASFIPEIIEHEAVLAELEYALRPVVHEGKIQPYGFIVCSCTDSLIYRKFADQTGFELNIARRIADGCHSFLIFTEGEFKGVFPLAESANDEYSLVHLQQSSQAVICITDNTGTTKIFCDEGVFIHQYRQWQRKPSIKQALSNIRRCVSPIDCEILDSILGFCFYELSPNKIGATLVWCLKSLPAKEMERFLPSTIAGNLQKRLILNMLDDVNRAILRHLLTYADGAVFIDAEGLVIGGGAHLKYSEDSRSLIKAYRGTRHTSAKRFSYDFPETVLFVVSSDGLVTVFSDGMNLVNLKTYSVDSVISDLSLPIEYKENATSFYVKEKFIECSNCKKAFKIQTMSWAESEEHHISCPVCNHFLYSTKCHVMSVYIVKNLLPQ